MTYDQARYKIKDMQRAINKIQNHIKAQFYYDNTHWKLLITKLKKEIAKLEELIYNEELEEYDYTNQEIDEQEAKIWGIKIIKI